MRYKIGETAAENAYAGSAHFVELTIFLTFLVGIGFLLAGKYGKQKWMTFWGWLTMFTCACFWGAQAMGVFKL